MVNISLRRDEITAIINSLKDLRLATNTVFTLVTAMRKMIYGFGPSETRRFLKESFNQFVSNNDQPLLKFKLRPITGEPI